MGVVSVIFNKTFISLINNISEAVIAISNDGNIVLINKIAEDLLGTSRENVLGKPIEKVLPHTNLINTLRTGIGEVKQNFISNGREFETNRIPITRNGNILGAFAVFQDITIIKSMKNEIDANKLYIDILNTIMDTANEWVVVVNGKGIITMMSKAYKEFLNCKNPEGKHVEEIIENTRMAKVLEIGKMEIGDIQEIKGNKVIAMRIPIIEKEKVVGAVGKVAFKDIHDFYFLSKKIINLQKELEFYKIESDKESKAKYSFEHIIGSSAKSKLSKEIAMRTANTNSNVLLIGESGTGKELFANAIHNASDRCLLPFVKINCAAIPQELIESELFGYEEGAFTGAKKNGKKGKFEIANDGTILLDEIGDMPMNMQVKLLRVLQEKEIERVGGTVIKKIDVRIIASTNKNLEDGVKNGTFREDLYYRLNVMRIVLPPLRERKEDIQEIANTLRIKVANRLDIYTEGISKEAIVCLTNYDWPGNIRELENVIERAINYLDADIIIKPKHLPEKFIQNKFKHNYNTENESLKAILKEVEREVISNCLKLNEWNKNKTSKTLGISRVGLYKKIEEYNLEYNK